MNTREKLIVLIMESVNGCARYWAEVIADHLLKNGVIVPPCKVGDKVYVLSQKSIQEYTVHAIEFNENTTTIKCHSWLAERESLLHKHIAYFNKTDFGKTVFLTREGAEKALAERSVKDGI